MKQGKYEIIEGDVRTSLLSLQDESVQCVVTSPPYYGLRNYDHKSQIGLEKTPEQYVSELVSVFRQCRRVLKNDGILWLNIGDSYWGGKGKSGYELPEEAEARRKSGKTIQKAHNVPGKLPMRPTDGKHSIIKPKDLIGIPWMVAFALRADGWYLRADVIWSKTNPKPESVTDRPTLTHEYVFLFSKNRKYYYDQDAIREPYAEASLPRALRGNSENGKWNEGAPGSSPHTMNKRRKNRRKEFEKEHGGGGSGLKGHSGYYSEDGRLLINPKGRNKWSVWNIATAHYTGSHFAVMPNELAKICILSGSREGDIGWIRFLA